MEAKSHYDYSDDQFEKLFSSCQLNPDLFTHTAHLRIAWILLTRYSPETALEHIRNQLKAFVLTAGAADKYHETLTTAGVHIVNHFMQRSMTNNFHLFLEENPRLRSDFRSLIDLHYHTDIFGSELARKIYIEPDSIPF